MSRASREKGKRGEREVADVFRRAGFKDAHRTGQMQANGLGTNADVLAVPGLHVEVKRQEVLKIPAWVEQATADAKPGEEPIVAFRQSRQPWRAVVDLEWLAESLADLERYFNEYLRRRGQMADAKDALACGDGEAAWDALNRHEHVTEMSRSGVGESHAPIQKTVDRELKLLGKAADEGGE